MIKKCFDPWDNIEFDFKTEKYSDNIHNLSYLGKITLILGRACNMNCPHCSQNVAKEYLAGKEISTFTLNWLKEWIKLRNGQKCIILFWGGEPLLYWDNIKYIVEQLYGLGDILFHIYTNGKLLDNEKCDFMEKHGITLTLSYDSPNPLMIRSEAPSEEVIKLFNKFKGKRRINSIYTAQTPNLIEAFNHLEEKFPHAEVGCGYIRAGLGVPDELTKFPKDKVRKDLTELFNYSLSNSTYNIRMWLMSKYLRKKYFEDVGYDEWVKYPFPYCGAGITNLAIDLDGNVYNCHNGNNIIGSLEEKSFNEIQDMMLERWRNHIPSKCKTCELASTCGNACTEYKRNESGDCLEQCDFFKDMINIAHEIIEGYRSKNAQR